MINWQFVEDQRNKEFAGDYVIIFNLDLCSFNAMEQQCNGAVYYSSFDRWTSLHYHFIYGEGWLWLIWVWELWIYVISGKGKMRVDVSMLRRLGVELWLWPYGGIVFKTHVGGSQNDKLDLGSRQMLL